MFNAETRKRLDAGTGCGSGIGKGWVTLVAQLDSDVAKLDNDYTINQIKEKFGGLRYYVTLSDGLSDSTYTAIRKIINKAEDDSYTICDRCGADGKQLNVNNTGYIATRCEEHKDT